MNEEKKMDATVCCASCGIAEVDDIKLVPCDGCYLVRYCSDECREDHKSDHEEACKKRAAEIREELLFKQPEGTHLGDCQICSLPLPIDWKFILKSCCSKFICDGCLLANLWREKERRLQHTCPFCREPMSKSKEEEDKLQMKRVEANDPDAMCKHGVEEYNKGDFRSAFEYFTKASEFGHAEAHFKLAMLYETGEGVEKDEGKEMYHYEEAAIGGHPNARYNLGCVEWENNDNTERAVKHWIISATLGEGDSIKILREFYESGDISKKEFASALRAYQTAVVATQSPQRKDAEEFFRGIDD